MGSTKIKAPERDYAQEYEKNLLTQLKYADKLYDSEATYQPKYADMQFNIAKKLTPQVMDLYQNEIYPRMAEMDRAAPLHSAKVSTHGLAQPCKPLSQHLVSNAINE